MRFFVLFLTQGGYVGAVLQEKYLFNAWIIVCHSGDFYLCEEVRTLYVLPEYVVLFLQCCVVQWFSGCGGFCFALIFFFFD